jgi:hypothetical protein
MGVVDHAKCGEICSLIKESDGKYPADAALGTIALLVLSD